MRQLERNLLVVTLVLSALGVVMVYSTTAIYANEHYGNSLFFFRRELMFVLLGLAGLVAARVIGVDRLRGFSVAGLCIAVLVLAGVLLLGHEAGGARRWFRFYGFSFQPIELVKPLVILYLADFLSRRQNHIKEFRRGFLPASGVVGVVVVLLLMQPDLGSAVLLTLVAVGLFFIAGIPKRYLAGGFLAGAPVLIALILAEPYRWRRITAFLNPWQDPQGAGFQSIQSFLAFTSGGSWGVGLGQSRQKLFFLPQAHTDFIYSIVGEELGLIGAAAVLVLFILFFWFGMRLALQSKNLYQSLLGIGIVLSIGLEAAIHMAVAVGVMPTKGMPLPFVSYGGSALVFHLVGVGLVLSLNRKRRYG